MIFNNTSKVKQHVLKESIMKKKTWHFDIIQYENRL